MFDIGFSEIALIFTLALIVLGPEKLPKVASQVGRWIGRARGMARQFREQLEEEVNLEETRRVTRQAATPSPPPASIEPTPPAALEQAAHDHTAHDHVEHEPFSPAAMHGEVTSATTDGAPMTSAEHADSNHAAASPAEPEQPVYPDHYSHAHPTDADGLPLPPPSPEPAVAESGQQDWVGGAVEEKPAQSSAASGYAPPHERGT